MKCDFTNKAFKFYKKRLIHKSFYGNYQRNRLPSAKWLSQSPFLFKF